MITPRYIGLSLSKMGLRAVKIKRRRGKTLIIGWTEQCWPSACLQPGYTKPNVIGEKTFMAGVGMVTKSLSLRNCGVALSLTDTVGKTLITTLNEPLKRGQEGINLLQWHVRDQLPFDAYNSRLAYQVIDRDPDGKTRVLVSAACNEVLEQYENLLAASGLISSAILFESLSLMHFFHGRWMPGGYCLLILWSSATLNLQLFRDGRLLACRNRPAPRSEPRMFQEVSQTLIGWEKNWPESVEAPAYLHTTAGNDGWKKTLEGALGRALLPATQSDLQLNDDQGSKPPTPEYYSTIGAAESLAESFGHALFVRRTVIYNQNRSSP